MKCSPPNTVPAPAPGPSAALPAGRCKTPRAADPKPRFRGGALDVSNWGHSADGQSSMFQQPGAFSPQQASCLMGSYSRTPTHPPTTHPPTHPSILSHTQIRNHTDTRTLTSTCTGAINAGQALASSRSAAMSSSRSLPVTDPSTRWPWCHRLPLTCWCSVGKRE